MTPRQIYFINLNRKIKAQKQNEKNNDLKEEVEGLKEKIKTLESELKMLHSQLKYERKLDMLRRKAILECGFEYEFVYSSHVEVLTKFIDEWIENNKCVY